MWGKDKTAEERRIAICIFDDVAEQCCEAALKYYDIFLPFLLEACNDENLDVRQAAVYGLGVCAEHGGSVFKHLVREALSRLNVVLQHPNAKHSDNVMAYDNVVSALGKVCLFHRDCIDSAQALCGKDLATEQTKGRMVNMLRHLQETLPPATLASTWSLLHPQQQIALQSILST